MEIGRNIYLQMGNSKPEPEFDLAVIEILSAVFQQEAGTLNFMIDGKITSFHELDIMNDLGLLHRLEEGILEIANKNCGVAIGLFVDEVPKGCPIFITGRRKPEHGGNVYIIRYMPCIERQPQWLSQLFFEAVVASNDIVIGKLFALWKLLKTSQQALHH